MSFRGPVLADWWQRVSHHGFFVRFSRVPVPTGHRVFCRYHLTVEFKLLRLCLKPSLFYPIPYRLKEWLIELLLHCYELSGCELIPCWERRFQIIHSLLGGVERFQDRLMPLLVPCCVW